MKKIALLWIVLVLAAPATAVELRLTPATPSVQPGDSLTLTLEALDLGGSALGDFDLDIGFDPGLLTLSGYAYTDALGTVGLDALEFGFGDLGGGVVNLGLVSLLSEADLLALQGDPLALATLDFTVGGLAPGASTPVEIATLYALGDGQGLPFAGVDLSGATLSRPGGGPQPIPMPTPGGLPLMVLGLVTLAGVVRMRRWLMA